MAGICPSGQPDQDYIDDKDYSAEGTMRYLRGVLKYLGVM